jgi:N-methylhydantoinase A/oxoprolinase/acetone carboxylase beta subunit
MPAVIVPSRAGVLSAVGLLTAPRQRDLVRSWPAPDDHGGLDGALAELAAEAAALVDGSDGGEVASAGTGAPGGAGAGVGAGGSVPGGAGAVVAGGDVTVRTAVDCRYRGQSHEVTVPSVEAFHAAHERRNGYARPGHPVEVVALRAVAVRSPAVALDDLPVVDRAGVGASGPVVVAEPDCTVWLPGGWAAEAGAAGALVLRRGSGVG